MQTATRTQRCGRLQGLGRLHRRRNQHYRAADVMNTEQVINFTIRYRDDIKPGMWVRFRGEKWDISTLGEYSFKRTYLGLKASLSKGVSG